jgi:xanthine dehydrogenase accessory factor
MTGGVLSALLADLAAKRAVVLAIDLAPGGAQGGEGAPEPPRERLVHPFDAAEAGDGALRDAARAAAEEDRSRRVELGGRAWFLRVYNPPVRVVIVGAVHVAQALAPMVQLAGYDAVVVDPRRAFATADRFAGVRVEAAWPDEALGRIGLDRRTAVVTMTHDPKIDDPALAAALRSDAFYVGALGSKKTQAARRERLRGEGFGDDAVARIRGPVGLPLGAVSPGEIAVSILSELVQALRGGRRERA